MGPGKETPQIRRQCLGKILEFDICVIVDTHTHTHTYTHTHLSVCMYLSTVHWSRTPEGIKSSGAQVPHIKWCSICIWFRSKGKLGSLSQEWRGTREHAFPARLWARLLYGVSSVGKGGDSREPGTALGSGSSAGAASLHTAHQRHLELHCTEWFLRAPAPLRCGCCHFASGTLFWSAKFKSSACGGLWANETRLSPKERKVRLY